MTRRQFAATEKALKLVPHVAILTRHDDFHAYVVRHVLVDRGDATCSIILTDSMASVGNLSWSTDPEVTAGTVRDVDGREVLVADLDVIWWRRLTGEPQIPVTLQDEAARDLVVNDCRAALLGLLLTDFTGLWVSHPEATRTAHNKLVQLRAAQRAGLRVPRTLVSQDAERVRRFCEDLEYRVIAKAVSGAQGTPTETGRATPELLTDAAVALCPAIYQEFVPGTRHLRVCAFGSEIHTAQLETEALDWRYPLDATVTPYRLDARTSAQVRQVISDLGLRMGIVDMKLTPEGTPIWLEVNPQGQFLFLEGMCRELPLTQLFCDFLVDECRVGARLRSAAGTDPRMST